MKLPQRVVWSEGLLMSPQHLQQLDAYHEQFVAARLAAVVPYPWGVFEVVLDPGMLQRGQLLVSRFSGILPDGTPLSFNAGDPGAPAARAIEGHFSAKQTALEVFLCMPKERVGAPNYGEPQTGRGRFRAVPRPVTDIGVPDSELSVAFAQPNLSVLFGDEPLLDQDTIRDRRGRPRRHRRAGSDGALHPALRAHRRVAFHHREPEGADGSHGVEAATAGGRAAPARRRLGRVHGDGRHSVFAAQRVEHVDSRARAHGGGGRRVPTGRVPVPAPGGGRAVDLLDRRHHAVPFVRVHEPPRDVRGAVRPPDGAAARDRARGAPHRTARGAARDARRQAGRRARAAVDAAGAAGALRDARRAGRTNVAGAVEDRVVGANQRIGTRGGLGGTLAGHTPAAAGDPDPQWRHVFHAEPSERVLAEHSARAHGGGISAAAVRSAPYAARAPGGSARNLTVGPDDEQETTSWMRSTS